MLVTLDADDAGIVAGLGHYMRDDVFTYPQLAQNLRAKLHDADFSADIDTLVATRPADYALDDAADLVMERLGALLHNAPAIDDICDGAWRA